MKFVNFETKLLNFRAKFMHSSVKFVNCEANLLNFRAKFMHSGVKFEDCEANLLNASVKFLDSKKEFFTVGPHLPRREFLRLRKYDLWLSGGAETKYAGGGGGKMNHLRRVARRPLVRVAFCCQSLADSSSESRIARFEKRRKRKKV
ncbi:MAG: hypothetical protein LBD58_00780 [Treponema sp.]|jgi:hypothetical protein|nr:hypothetical protein [Treponema sp.]